jgi:hypothetical protein
MAIAQVKECRFQTVQVNIQLKDVLQARFATIVDFVEPTN